MKLVTRSLLAIAMVYAGMAAAEDRSEEVVRHLQNTMPNTEWTGATPLKNFPGYYHLSFKGKDPDTQYYFDAERKILVIGMMVNLDVGSRMAKNQKIAPGSSN